MSITVKICGITRAEDAESASAAGADALGFNFYGPSPRYVDPDRAGAMETGTALRVGVFVNAPPHEVSQITRTARLDIVQLHGDEDPADYPGLRVWKAYRVTAAWTAPSHSNAEALLLDGPAPGSGAAFDWNMAKHISSRFLIAGGLDADNVTEAIRIAKPWGVDACSLLECSPGVKDPEKVARFIRAARMATV
jgi:phosphoribosylanthranilate isomerase